MMLGADLEADLEHIDVRMTILTAGLMNVIDHGRGTLRNLVLVAGPESPLKCSLIFDIVPIGRLGPGIEVTRSGPDALGQNSRERPIHAVRVDAVGHADLAQRRER